MINVSTKSTMSTRKKVETLGDIYTPKNGGHGGHNG